jgi:hypothetical protein
MGWKETCAVEERMHFMVAGPKLRQEISEDIHTARDTQ